jgi:hypothetical protein
MSDERTTLRLRVADALVGPPVDWAADLLRGRLEAVGRTSPLRVVVAHSDHGPQGFSLRRADGVTITATDPVGASYALVGLADQIELTNDPDRAVAALDGTEGTTNMPVRGIMRSFSSVDEDLPWFVDRDFWPEYLDWIAQARFNRFHLAFGMQYNYGADRNGATDNYLCFAYPFLLEVPDWDVRADGVSDSERSTNLEMLQYIGAETRRRGMKFQLGLWNHAYDYGRNSRHRFEIRGITPETHADYCAAAMTELLVHCPDIDGISFRVHYEGGVPDEGHEVFWGKVFDAISASGRSMQVDMHAKGVDDALLQAVDKPGLHAVLGAKYWAEHQGLPYHQASIRHRERAKPVPPGHEMTAVTEFSRRFTRYGYADFLSDDRRADLIFRVWPGTQKLLLWGDPELAAGYGRLATFAGSLGVDVCEPLYFKGRKGSGAPGRRDPYIAPELKLGLRDWTKYAYTYRIWGRKLYNPDASAHEWAGYLQRTYGELAEAVEGALAQLSRILPLVTVVHGVGASNNGYWPEVYTNLPITAGVDPAHYGRDTEPPPMWGTVSPFDPTMFYVINDWAADALRGRLNGKYTPVEVAGWIEACVDNAAAGVAALVATESDDPQVRRTAIDVQVLSCLGQFFAAKFRSAADYALYQLSGDRTRLEAALAFNEQARGSFAKIVLITEGVYQANMMFGPELNEHGSWTDRLPAIEADVAAMADELRGAARDGSGGTVTAPDRPVQSGIQHTPPSAYSRGDDVRIEAKAEPDVVAVRLHYRHVNQAEDFQVLDLSKNDDGFADAVPAAYTASTYPLMYFFTVDRGAQGMTIHPGLEPTLANQPYYVVRADAS